MSDKELRVSVGLYRHFKGDYFYVTGLSRSALDEKTVMVNYFNVCYPEFGNFVRPLSDFTSDLDDKATAIVLRKDNATGQHRRFERVRDLNFQLGSISTEQLIAELRTRTDSPIHELDIEGLNSSIFCRDYVVGEAFEENDNLPRGVYTESAHTTREEAERYLSTHQHKRNTRVFKRTFIEIE